MDNPNEQNSKHTTKNRDDESRNAGLTDHLGVDPHSNIAPDKARMPCGHKLNGRNLVVCIDGTSNQFGDKNTNVIELYNLILKEIGDNQRTWYNSGIGTYAQPSWKSLSYYKKVLYHKIDLAIAWNFERTVLGAYRWLSDNYEEDDCIFLFGFSRGAFQVRVLSAMIEKVGLIYKGNKMQIPFAYELYADPNSGKRSVSVVGSQDATTKADRFKKAFSHKKMMVHFVGAWDTVSSIGIARGKSTLPGTVDGMTHVCYFRHALALDERRVKFLPEYAGGSAHAIDSKETLPQTKEVWFAGTHSDIGGGNVDNHALNRSTPPLRWMVYEAGKAGLRTALFEGVIKNSDLGEINIIESLTWPWRFFEICPFERLTFTRGENGRKMTRMPHLGSPRKIHRGQKIHSSVLRAGQSTAQKYIPKARPCDDDKLFWEKLRDEAKEPKEHTENGSQWLELDLYELIKLAVEELVTKGDNTTLKSWFRSTIFTSTLSFGDACRALYENVMEAQHKKELPLANKYLLLRTTMDLFEKSSRDDLDFKSSEIELVLSNLLELDLDEVIKLAFEELVTKGNNTTLTSLHTTSIFSSISGDARQAVYKNAIEALYKALTLENKRLLLQTTMHLLKRSSRDDLDFKLSPLTQIVPLLDNLFWDNSEYRRTAYDFVTLFTNFVKTVQLKGDFFRFCAISPDGTRIASGNRVDNLVQIWDAETGTLMGEPLRGHTRCVWSVAFSPDGTRIVSGSGDRTVRIWDAETGLPMGEPLRGHDGWVISVAFSPNSRRIVSGSDDGTVRIWDAGTGSPVGEPLRGHKNWVRSVAFSPDGRCVVSGSDDGTVRICDAETGSPVGVPLEGHIESVWSVAFSPDGTRIVSGSKDRRVRIWDVKTSSPVGLPLIGHNGCVNSVAFSPDGRRIVSASDDRTVRIWNAEGGSPVGEPLQGHTGFVLFVAVSSDSTCITSFSEEGTVRIWDTEALEMLNTIGLLCSEFSVAEHISESFH